VRSAAPERAADALRRLSDIARACGTDWALGAEARSRALVTEGEAAKNLYREAIGRRVAERARTGLRAAGGHARQRAVEPRDSLTAQEAPIARLAG
jgi:hypothetical protein